jgi:hypothetical protein
LDLFQELVDPTLLLQTPFTIIDHRGPHKVGGEIYKNYGLVSTDSGECIKKKVKMEKEIRRKAPFPSKGIA